MQAIERDVRLPFAPDLGAMLRPMLRGRLDPTMRFADGGVWRTATTPAGPGTQWVGVVARDGASTTVLSRTWGLGAEWLAERAPDLLGACDDPNGFDVLLASAGPAAPLAPVWLARGPGWRVPKGHHVWESAVAAVLEQKVTGLEAKRAWRGLAGQFGVPAPGPAPDGMVVLPDARRMRRVPTWTWRRLGVESSRSDTIMRLAEVPHVVDRLPELPVDEARRRLTSLAGIGEWTYAEVAQRALGDADAVSVGDFHLAGDVVYAFTGRMDGDNADMLALLAPFAGHRYRAVRMIELAGIHKPRRGPRMAIPVHRYG